MDGDARQPRFMELPAKLRERTERFVELLLRWNERHNLTGFSSRADVFERGIEDSLRALALLPGTMDGLDVGSGGGFPAIPMAIAEPQRCWVLLEPRRKRASFLREVIRQLHLTHVDVRQQRLQQYDGSLSLVTSRAVGGLTGPIASRLAPGGCWIRAMSMENADRFSHPLLQLVARTPSPIHGQCWVRLERPL